jgi:hypothetical protein
MGLIYPNQSKTRHWDGALQARLRRAPLEEFLSRHSLKIAHGASRDCDNLARATVYLIEGGSKIYFYDREDGLAESQQGVIGRLACLTARALAELIGEPASWRTAALVSTAQLLTPWIGLQAAACASAGCIRQFTVEQQDDLQDMRMAAAASVAVQHCDGGSMLAVTEIIANRLATAGAARSPARLPYPSRLPRSRCV